MLTDKEKDDINVVIALVSLAKSRLEGIRLRLGIAETSKAESELIEAKDILYALMKEK